MTNNNSTSSTLHSSLPHNDDATKQLNDDVEYYPRNKRAPYLYDLSEFGILRPTSSSRYQHGAATDGEGWDMMNEDGDILNSSGTGVLKSASSSSLSQPNNIRRRSSFARVFSTLGMSSATVVEDDTAPATLAANQLMGGPDDSAGGGGGGKLGGGMSMHNTLQYNSHANFEQDSDQNLLPPRFRKGSSAADIARRMSVDSVGTTRDRLGSHGNLLTSTSHQLGGGPTKRVPPWALGTLVHQHALIHQRSSTYNYSQQQHQHHYIVTPTWRIKDRMKTVGVCLVLALNIGTDPPDLNKPTPCAKLQCWLDPTSISRAKAKERIGERLEQQYSKWQQRSKLKYRRALDPTVDMVKELCFRMRESAKQERVLLHYNGHGVPRPTANGEIWLFDKHHTNYIPLSVTDLRRWIGKPSIVVLDCSGAGVLMPFFTTTLHDPTPNAGVSTGTGSYNRLSSTTMGDNSDPSDATTSGAEYLKAIRDTIVLCPTAQGEWLPLNPEFPADLFTSCLTTPIPIALRWFVHQNPLSTQGLDLDTIADAIPGKLTDRKTPLGELNWIFTAITDTIAWNVLPSPLFQRLFRQDLLVASMFRNFLLADRILRSMNCTPMSNPELPSTCQHPLWNAWDLAVETCLTQLIDSGHLRTFSDTEVKSSPSDGEATDGSASEPPTSPRSPQKEGVSVGKAPPTTVPEVNAPFFAEQLTSFELWLQWASMKPRNKLVIRCPPSAVGDTPLPFLQRIEDAEKASHELDPPQELPIVLQVLLSQAHRVRALVLLKRFLDLGPSAVNLALSVGIFPYVLKLLQSPIDEYKHVLVGIWTKVIEFDSSCQEDVVKDRALPHFIRHLRWGIDPSSSAKISSPEDASDQRTMAAFILSVICSGYTLGQSECINEKLHITCGSLLQSLESPDESERKKAEAIMAPQFRMWIIICLGNLTKDNASAQSELYKTGLHFQLLARLADRSPDVRMASCYALGFLIGSAPVKPTTNEASTLSSMLLQPQQHAPQTSLAGSGGLMPGTMPSIGLNLNPPSRQLTGSSPLMSTFNPSITSPAAQLRPQGGVNLIPGKQQPMMFGNMLSPTNPVPPTPVTSPPPDIKTVYEDNQRMELDLSVAIKLAETTIDASPEVRFEALLAVNRFIGKYIDAFVSIAGQSSAAQQGRNILGGGSLQIEMPEGISSNMEKQMTKVWTAVLKLHKSDPFPSIKELANSIVVAINTRVVVEQRKLRRSTLNRRRRRSLAGSIDETGAEVDFAPPPTLADRGRSITGGNLSTYSAETFSVGTPPGVPGSPRKGSFQALDPSTHVDEYFYPESLFYSWKKVEFGEKDAYNQTFDPLSDKGAMKRYRETRNSLTRQKSQLLKDTFAVLAERPTIRRSPYDYDESDAAAGIREREMDLRKEALQMEQVSLLQNSGARSTSLLRFHPYEPALVVCGSGDNISVWNAETSERMSAFSNMNPKNTRMTSALWVNEASTSLLMTGSNDGTVKIFDVSY